MHLILCSKQHKGAVTCIGLQCCPVSHSTHRNTAVAKSTGQPSRGKCIQSTSEKGKRRNKGLGQRAR